MFKTLYLFPMSSEMFVLQKLGYGLLFNIHKHKDLKSYVCMGTFRQAFIVITREKFKGPFLGKSMNHTKNEEIRV